MEVPPDVALRAERLQQEAQQLIGESERLRERAWAIVQGNVLALGLCLLIFTWPTWPTIAAAWAVLLLTLALWWWNIRRWRKVLRRMDEVGANLRAAIYEASERHGRA